MDGLWTYLCVCVSGVPAYVMSGREPILIACGSWAGSYNGFGSLTCCSVMSRFCWRYIWMYMFSQWFIFLLFCMDVLVLECRFLFYIHVCYSVYVLRMLMPGYWFWCILYVLYVLLLWVYLTVQHNSYCMCCILSRIFHLGFYFLLFRQLLIYCFVSFECYANICIFKQIGYLCYQWAMVCENCPFFVLCVFLLFFLGCNLFVLLLGYFFLFLLWITFLGKPFFWAKVSMYFH